jgi:K+-transporting ATPase KdpF subunit
MGGLIHHAGCRNGTDSSQRLWTVRLTCGLVRNGCARSGGRPHMIIVTVVAVLLFGYLAIALLNPEKF